MSSPAQLYFEKRSTAKAVQAGERGLVFRSHYGARSFLHDVRSALEKRTFWDDTPRLAVLLLDALRGFYSNRNKLDDRSVEYDADYYIQRFSDRDAYFQVNIQPNQQIQIQSLFGDAIVWSGGFTDYLDLGDGFFKQAFEYINAQGCDQDDEQDDENGARPSAPVGARYFEYRAASSRKFWKILRSGASVTTRYGKIGARGQQATKRLKNERLAERETDKLVAEKLRKGYVERVAPRAVAQAKPQHDTWRPTVLVSFDDEIFLTTDRSGGLLEKVKSSLKRFGPDPGELFLCHHLVDNLRDIADLRNVAHQVQALRACTFSVGLSGVRPAHGFETHVGFTKAKMAITTFAGGAETVVWRGTAEHFAKR